MEETLSRMYIAIFEKNWLPSRGNICSTVAGSPRIVLVARYYKGKMEYSYFCCDISI